MDTLTHMALGACIAQAIGYRKIGAKTLAFGALCGLIPDLDVLVTPFTGEFGGWKYHRHITHSIWFVALLTPLMGWVLWRHYGRQAGDLKYWLSLIFFALLSHPLLDMSTIYGTQFFAPFSTARLEIPAISIIDPVYSFLLLGALLSLLCTKLRPHARVIATSAIVLTTAYILYGWHLNTKAEDIATAQLKEQNIPVQNVQAFTTIFQPHLRRVIAWDSDNRLRVGFVSTFSPQHIYWGCQTQEPQAVKEAILKTEAGSVFNWFSGGILSISKGNTDNQAVVSDARYGIPGESLFGWWGQSYTLDDRQEGNLTATYTGRVQYSRNASLHAIYHLFRASYGLPNDFMMTKDEGC